MATWYTYTQSGSLEGTWNGEEFNNSLKTGECMKKIHGLMRGWRAESFPQKKKQEKHQEEPGGLYG